MHREDKSKFLLYIEPNYNKKSKEPVNDILTEIMQLALDEAEKGVSNYSHLDEEPRFNKGFMFRGFHTTSDGKNSSNCDYLLKNGMITNSLCVYYLQYYRSSIPLTEIEKLNELSLFYLNDPKTKLFKF